MWLSCFTTANRFNRVPNLKGTYSGRSITEYKLHSLVSRHILDSMASHWMKLSHLFPYQSQCFDHLKWPFSKPPLTDYIISSIIIELLAFEQLKESSQTLNRTMNQQLRTVHDRQSNRSESISPRPVVHVPEAHSPGSRSTSSDQRHELVVNAMDRKERTTGIWPIERNRSVNLRNHDRDRDRVISWNSNFPRFTGIGSHKVNKLFKVYGISFVQFEFSIDLRNPFADQASGLTLMIF